MKGDGGAQPRVLGLLERNVWSSSRSMLATYGVIDDGGFLVRDDLASRKVVDGIPGVVDRLVDLPAHAIEALKVCSVVGTATLLRAVSEDAGDEDL